MFYDDKFTLRALGLFMAFVAAVIFACEIGSDSKNKSKAMQDLIAKGVDPIKARCAVYGPVGENMRDMCLDAARK